LKGIRFIKNILMKKPIINFNRRSFLEMAAIGAGTIFLPKLSFGQETYENPGNGTFLFQELARNLSVVDDVDVIVCGGGPAGVSAAITAARSGAKVRLFEVNGCLGGIWTAGLLTWIFDFNKPGLTKEITVKLDERGARRGTDPGMFVYEPDEMKLLLEDLCVEAGVKFRLQTRLVAAYRDGQQLTTIITESRSGREAWRAKVFVDATGDGDLGALAGCNWDIGQEKDCPCQPLTMNALAAVGDVTKLQKYISFYGGGDMTTHLQAVKQFKEEINRSGINPSYGMPTLFHVRDNVVLLMVNHEYGVKPYDADAMTSATVRARKEIFKIARGLRQLGGIWDGFQIIASAEQIGIRDGRRIHGRYKIVKDDLVKGARFDDGVCKVTFGVDIHADTKANNDKETITRGGIKSQPYDIPLRALIAKDVDGLMMAGRCISGDFIAHASYRVTGNAVAMGEAVGIVAAIAAQSKHFPHEVEWKEAKKSLEEMKSHFKT
jgi:hypothetical protein